MKVIRRYAFLSAFVLSIFLSPISYAATSLEKCVASRVIGSFVDVDFSPHKISSRTQSHVQMETNAMLYRRGRDGSVINELAKNTKIDLKKRTMQVEIDTSCHWSDGRPITVYDIQEGIHRLFSVEEPTILSLYLKNGIDINNGDKDLSELGLRILNDTTLEFYLVVTPLVLQHMFAFNAATPAPIHLGTKWPGDGSSMVRIGSGPFVAVSHTEKIINFEYNDYDRVMVEGRLDKPYIKRLAQAQKIMDDKGYGPNNTQKLSFELRHSMLGAQA